MDLFILSICVLKKKNLREAVSGKQGEIVSVFFGVGMDPGFHRSAREAKKIAFVCHDYMSCFTFSYLVKTCMRAPLGLVLFLSFRG